MKNRLFITVIEVFFTLNSATSWSMENPAIRNPAGLSTVPPSSIQSGLISNPNPIDMSGNLLITGNVRRGRHFRGTVPYGSTTSFKAGLGSSSLSSFLRDSAGTEDFGRYANGYSIQPYYLQSQTVTTTIPGYSGVFRPIGARINGRALQVQYQTGMKTTKGQEKQAYSGWDTLAQADTSRESSESGLQRPQTQYGTSTKPLKIVQSIRELQLLTQDEAGKSPQDRQLMVERYQKQTQDSRLKTQDPLFKTQDSRLKTQDTGTGLEQNFVVWGPEHKQSRIAEIAQSTKPEFSADVLTPGQADAVVKGLAFQDRTNLQKVMGWESQADEVKIDEHGREDVQGQRDRLGSDVLERLKQQLDDLTRSVEGRLQTGTEEARKNQSIKTDTVSSPRVTMIDRDEVNKLSHAELAAKAKRIREPYTNPESYSEAKFNQHIRAAENYLKTGRYYAAADSFALASIYKLDEPLSLAGRGHALFAAGEYISSALFLSRALEIAPEYARTKIDFAVMLGGEDKLENRIADIKEWLGKSGSGQLEFLLGYVYYQMGRLGPAKQAINAASVKMPKSPAIDILKKAIDDKIAG